MDGIVDVAHSIGDALNGVFQVVCDFLNLLASILPNPDPFPAMIENVQPAESWSVWGFAAYWLDQAVSVQFLRDGLTVWIGVMIVGMTFAIIYWGIKAVKP